MKSIADVWKNVLDRLRTQLSETTIDTWFDEVDVITMEDSAFVLHCSNTFKKSTIEARFMRHIKEALKDIFSADLEVKILNDDQLTAYHGVAPDRPGALYESDAFTFETYVVGPSNKLAYAAAKAVAERPAENYNPLFIYGDSGLGKTHLLYAIANGIRKKIPNANIVYIKGDQFTNELVDAIKTSTNIEFRNKYREADLFLIDDIQFIAGKDSTQEEFFHTFNKLYEEHKQIVMTSDRKPSDMLTLEERLKSRFEWGLIMDIQPPDYETRMAIIQNKANSLGLELPADVCDYIATNVTNNVRQIEGTVKKILAYRDLNNMPLDLPNVSRAINDMFKSQGEALPTPNLIIDQVCRFFSVEESTLRGSQKSKGIAEARQTAMYLIRKLTNLSLPDIGKEFGKDHSTVLYNIRKVETALKKNDTTTQNNIRDITSNINSSL